MEYPELNERIKKLAKKIRDYSEETGQDINYIIEAVETDFHPDFSEPVGELVYDMLGWDCYTEYDDKKFSPKFEEVMHHLRMMLELEAF